MNTKLSRLFAALLLLVSSLSAFHSVPAHAQFGKILRKLDPTRVLPKLDPTQLIPKNHHPSRRVNITPMIAVLKRQTLEDANARPVANLPLYTEIKHHFGSGFIASVTGDLYQKAWLGSLKVESKNEIRGFTGGVALVGVSSDGNVTFVSRPISLGVDGRLFSFLGFTSSSREALYQFDLDPEVAVRTVDIKAVFYNVGKSRWRSLIAEVDDIIETIQNSKTGKTATEVIGAIAK